MAIRRFDVGNDLGAHRRNFVNYSEVSEDFVNCGHAASDRWSVNRFITREEWTKPLIYCSNPATRMKLELRTVESNPFTVRRCGVLERLRNP